MKTPVEKLDWDMKVTAGSRFSAAARLKRSFRAKQWFLVIFSTLIVLISAVALVFSFSPFYNRLLGFIALASSILVLVFSAAQIENEDSVTAHKLYQSAVQISGMRREFAALANSQREAALGEMTQRYNDALVLHGVNHDTKDYRRYKLDHWWEFDDLKDLTRSRLFSAKLGQSVEENLPRSALWGAFAAAAAGVAASVISAMGI